jgi:hypothetical protein
VADLLSLHNVRFESLIVHDDANRQFLPNEVVVMKFQGGEPSNRFGLAPLQSTLISSNGIPKKPTQDV